jgi:hypothetical protein
MRSKSFILSALPDAAATRAGGGSHSGDMTAGLRAQRWRDTRLAA